MSYVTYVNKNSVHVISEIKNPNIKQLILLGKTGDGKSTFGNRLCGDRSKFGDQKPFKSTNDPQSGNAHNKLSISLCYLCISVFNLYEQSHREFKKV